MAQIQDLIKGKDVKTWENVRNKVPKTSIKREIINNLLYRVSRRSNIAVEMNGHYVKSIRIALSSNARHWVDGAVMEKNLHIWVKPYFVTDKNGFVYLMFNYNGVKFRASDVFGNSINYVRLS